MAELNMRNRVRVVDIQYALLAEMLKSHEAPGYRLISEIPDDAEIIQLSSDQWDFTRMPIGRLHLLVWSSTFRAVPEGEIPPTWEPTISISYGASA
jgi:hypothetical protein